ncbi:hypothetical protein SLEP1_g57594 [Rubroshorea leprosula]|uniref:Uncharacterized protein n=1 Tax=Rubroshorea leprosula TaxID=152421 RepID=A0AAV5MM52_9ROSI|nr:hypothetical protein SLEP1_g57594 [Rubroshorea leprosula]
MKNTQKYVVARNASSFKDKVYVRCYLDVTEPPAKSKEGEAVVILVKELLNG